MAIQTLLIPVTTVGADGVAAGTATSTDINGEILAIQLDFDATAPVTTDTVITTSNPSDTLLSVSNTVTDKIHYVRNIGSLNDGTQLAGDNQYLKFIIQGSVTVTLAQSNALAEALEARIYYRNI